MYKKINNGVFWNFSCFFLFFIHLSYTFAMKSRNLVNEETGINKRQNAKAKVYMERAVVGGKEFRIRHENRPLWSK